MVLVFKLLCQTKQNALSCGSVIAAACHTGCQQQRTAVSTIYYIVQLQSRYTGDSSQACGASVSTKPEIKLQESTVATDDHCHIFIPAFSIPAFSKRCVDTIIEQHVPLWRFCLALYVKETATFGNWGIEVQ